MADQRERLARDADAGVGAAYPGGVAEKSNTRSQAPADVGTQAVPEKRRTELLRGLSERTFTELSYGPLGVRQRLDEHRAEIFEIAARYGASNVRVFGSVAREEDNGESDIDLLVDLPAGATLLSLAGLAEELTILMGVNVDVATAEILRDEIRADAIASATPL